MTALVRELQAARAAKRFTPTIPVPAYIRQPTGTDVDSIFELNRGAWDLLTRPQRGNNFKPPVRSVLVRHGGKGHGIKLIDVRSALVFFSSLPNEAERLGQAA